MKKKTDILNTWNSDEWGVDKRVNGNLGSLRNGVRIKDWNLWEDSRLQRKKKSKIKCLKAGNTMAPLMGTETGNWNLAFGR